jgi:hypothetical protein
VNRAAQQRVAERNVLDRIVRRRKHAPDFARPALPGAGAPEVVDPEEPALEQVVAKAFSFFRLQTDRADVGRDNVGQLKSCGSVARTTQVFGSRRRRG